MSEWLRSWFEPSAFSPHGFCLLWEPGLIWLHAVSDVLIALAYFSIPLALLAFLRRRRDFGFPGLALLFIAFIALCGLTHVIGALTLWQSWYWLEGGVKAATAAVSVVTAIAIWPLIPRALAIPSPAALEREVAEKTRLLRALEEARDGLERRVAERTADLARVNQRFEAALAASGVTVFSQDDRLAYTFISKDELGRTPEQFIGRTDAEVLPAADQEAIIALKRGVLDSGTPARAEVRAAGKWYDLSVEPLRDEAGIICGAVDVTARKRDEARIRFLFDEVKHRVGNLLAVAQAMLRQTAETSANVEELVDRYGQRLRALAGSQQLLVREGPRRAGLHEVIGSQLGYLEAARFHVDGPEVVLDDAAVLHIGMALHELATNAAKYGALSVPGGQVSITWTVADGRCTLRWAEHGGPPVRPSNRRGFGREVIEWAAAQAVRGTVRLDLPPEGLRWELDFPLQGVEDGIAYPSG
ncbi:sensor histidine kinase [Roseococcus sp. DSY-14]|uniref:sensor histidine kinase n=1 Tax=Roseococcus sp. DSY-14 TaxID=3369650 RepID=UPI00387B8133